MTSKNVPPSFSFNEVILLINLSSTREEMVRIKDVVMDEYKRYPLTMLKFISEHYDNRLKTLVK